MRIYLVVLLACLVCITGVIENICDAVEVDIPDPNLEAAFREALEIPAPTPLTSDDLASLTDLVASAREIFDLTGLEYCVNLERLYLAQNQISDISPLAGLISLEWLILFSNQISDITPLAGLINLQELWFRENQVTDISPLAGLINLVQLGLGGNQISDTSPLAGLINLRSLWLWGNQISDISPLARLANLERLWLWRNQITDIGPLAGLINLKKLWLWGNQINDISPLATLINMEQLALDDNHISDLQPLVDNAGMDSGDYLDVQSNPLSYKSINTDIPMLQSRGVDVDFNDRVPTTLAKLSGDGQTGYVRLPLPELLVVEVKDQEGKTFEGVPIAFTVTTGGGSLSNVDSATDTDGQAAATLTLGASSGANTVEVYAADIPASVTFTATAITRCSFSVISPDTTILDELHEFRDRVLTSNETGQELTYLYDQYSPEIARILLETRILALRGAAILMDVMPGIRFLLQERSGRDIVMDRLLVVRIQKLFADISAEGSDKLDDTLSELGEMLDSYKGMRISRIWRVLERKQMIGEGYLDW